MKKGKIRNRIVAIITLWCFLFTAGLGEVFVETAWSAEVPQEEESSFAQLDVDTFTVPAHLGEVRHTFKGASDKFVIHLQDAHCNYFAQQKISGIIDYLNKEYGIHMVNLEGGEGDYDLTVFTSIKGETIRSEVAAYFAEKGEINGAELFAINNPEKVMLWGVEDKVLYLENLKVYRDSLTCKEEVDKFLKELTHILNNLKRHIFTRELLSLDIAYNAYKAGNMEFREYLKFLITEARAQAIEVRKFANLYLLAQAMQQEDEIDFKKANRERDMLIDELKENLSKNEIEEVVVRTVDFKTRKISEKVFYGFLLRKARELGLDMERFPALSRYTVYVATYEAVDLSRVSGEMEALEYEIKGPLYQNDTQRRLNALSRNLALMKNIFAITLTREDYSCYIADKRSFEVSNYLEFIRKESPKYKIGAQPGVNITRLDHYRENMEKFYEYSFKRDEAFFRNMRFGSNGNGLSSAVLMTGGFHTETLRGLFEKEGISYVSICPKFTSEEDYKCPYFDLLAGRSAGVQSMLRAAFIKAGAATLQIASKLSPVLAGYVYGDADAYSFQGAVVIQTLVTQGNRVVVVDQEDNPVFEEGSGEEVRITVAELLRKAGYTGEIGEKAAGEPETKPEPDRTQLSRFRRFVRKAGIVLSALLISPLEILRARRAANIPTGPRARKIIRTISTVRFVLELMLVFGIARAGGTAMEIVGCPVSGLVRSDIAEPGPLSSIDASDIDAQSKVLTTVVEDKMRTVTEGKLATGDEFLKAYHEFMQISVPYDEFKEIISTDPEDKRIIGSAVLKLYKDPALEEFRELFEFIDRILVLDLKMKCFAHWWQINYHGRDEVGMTINAGIMNGDPEIEPFDSTIPQDTPENRALISIVHEGNHLKNLKEGKYYQGDDDSSFYLDRGRDEQSSYDVQWRLMKALGYPAVEWGRIKWRADRLASEDLGDPVYRRFAEISDDLHPRELEKPFRAAAKALQEEFSLQGDPEYVSSEFNLGNPDKDKPSFYDITFKAGDGGVIYKEYTVRVEFEIVEEEGRSRIDVKPQVSIFEERILAAPSAAPAMRTDQNLALKGMDEETIRAAQKSAIEEGWAFAWNMENIDRVIEILGRKGKLTEEEAEELLDLFTFENGEAREKALKGLIKNIGMRSQYWTEGILPALKRQKLAVENVLKNHEKAASYFKDIGFTETHLDEIRSRRFVVLFSRGDVFSEGKVLAHSSANKGEKGSIYMHVNAISAMSLDTMGLVMIHENNDAARQFGSTGATGHQNDIVQHVFDETVRKEWKGILGVEEVCENMGRHISPQMDMSVEARKFSERTGESLDKAMEAVEDLIDGRDKKLLKDSNLWGLILLQLRVSDTMDDLRRGFEELDRCISEQRKKGVIYLGFASLLREIDDKEEYKTYFKKYASFVGTVVEEFKNGEMMDIYIDGFFNPTMSTLEHLYNGIENPQEREKEVDRYIKYFSSVVRDMKKKVTVKMGDGTNKETAEKLAAHFTLETIEAASSLIYQRLLVFDAKDAPAVYEPVLEFSRDFVVRTGEQLFDKAYGGSHGLASACAHANEPGQIKTNVDALDKFLVSMEKHSPGTRLQNLVWELMNDISDFVEEKGGGFSVYLKALTELFEELDGPDVSELISRGTFIAILRLGGRLSDDLDGLQPAMSDLTDLFLSLRKRGMYVREAEMYLGNLSRNESNVKGLRKRAHAVISLKDKLARALKDEEGRSFSDLVMRSTVNKISFLFDNADDFAACVSSIELLVKGLAAVKDRTIVMPLVNSLADFAGVLESREKVQVAIEIAKAGFIPTTNIVEYAMEKGDTMASIQDFIRIRKDIENGGFKLDEITDQGRKAIYVDVEYTHFSKVLFENGFGVYRTNYEGYLKFVQGEHRPGEVVLDIIGYAEIDYAIHEAMQLLDFAREAKGRADSLEKDLVVVANMSYGGFVIDIIEEELAELGIRIIRTKIGSTESHSNPWVFREDLFTDEDLEYIVKEQPLMIVVDGTANLTDRESGEGLKMRNPDSNYGYRNFDFVMDEALAELSGDTRKPYLKQLGKDEDFLQGFTESFSRLKSKIADIMKSVENFGETLSYYDFLYWNPNGMTSVLRESRQAVREARCARANDIKGPCIIFANTVMLDERIPDKLKFRHARMPHNPAFFDDNDIIKEIFMSLTDYGVQFEKKLKPIIRERKEILYSGEDGEDDGGNGESGETPLSVMALIFGNISAGLSPEEEVLWRAKIDAQSDMAKELNKDAVDAVKERSKRLLKRKADIKNALEERSVPGAQIDAVIKALKKPDRRFKWFNARVEGVEKYMLGHENALAVNIIRYLIEQEGQDGINDLLDEYILHEVLERTGLEHGSIIKLTNSFFNRPGFEKPGDTPLGQTLRSFINSAVIKLNLEQLKKTLAGQGPEVLEADAEKDLSLLNKRDDFKDMIILRPFEDSLVQNAMSFLGREDDVREELKKLGVIFLRGPPIKTRGNIVFVNNEPSEVARQIYDILGIDIPWNVDVAPEHETVGKYVRDYVLSRPCKVIEMLRNMTGEKTVSLADLTGEVKLEFHEVGSHKMVFRLIFDKKGDEEIYTMFQMALKKERREDAITAQELDDLELLQLCKFDFIPKLGMRLENDEGYIEEFISGKTAWQLLKENENGDALTLKHRKKIIEAILMTGDILGAVPKDIHGKNFIIDEEKDRVVFIDIGHRRISLSEILRNSGAMSLVSLLVGYYGFPEKSNDFIFETIEEGFPGGLSVLELAKTYGNTILYRNGYYNKHKEKDLTLDAEASSNLHKSWIRSYADLKVVVDQLSEYLAKRYFSIATGRIYAGLTPEEEVRWREEIDAQSDRVIVANGDAVDTVKQRSKRLLERKTDIKNVLKERSVPDGQIDAVLKALKKPARSFKWFNARVENAEKYMLGHENALAVNIVRYLMDRERQDGIEDLLDEYILHEALEKTELKHEEIVELTNAFFSRKSFEKRGDTPLGRALRAFIEVEASRFKTELQVESAKTIISDFRQNRTDIIVMPGSEIYVAYQESVNRKAVRKLHRDYGQETLPYSYEYGKNWRESLKELMKENVAAAFEKSREKNPRILLYLPIDQTERENIFNDGGILEEFSHLADYITIIQETNIPENGIVDNVMHIILGKSLLNYERFKGRDFGQEAQFSREAAERLVRFVETLVEPGTIDFGSFEKNPEQLLKKILNGDISLHIKKIDFTEIRDWKEAQNQVLRSL